MDLFNDYKCFCSVGYIGRNCLMLVIIFNSCDLYFCQYGVICVKNVDGFDICYCFLGYIGLYCEIDINECLIVMCYNGGICVDVVNGFKCVCLIGFLGLIC